jgi:hypothetical protein
MPVASNPGTRASDADRDQTAAALREHLAAGRLTIEEFDERLDQAYAAKTLGELDKVTADLPGTGLGQLPDTPADRPAASPPLTRCPPGSIEAGRDRFSPAWRAAWGSWLAISLFLFVIWLASGASGGPWSLWVALALGAILLGPLDHRSASAQGTQTSPAAEEPQAFRRPGHAVTARATDELVSIRGEQQPGRDRGHGSSSADSPARPSTG